MSRLHKIGSIYKRIEGLLRSGVIKKIDKPLWFDVYTSFPPTYEPTFNRPVLKTEPVREIFYPEDIARGKLHLKYPEKFSFGSLDDNGEESPGEKYIKLYKEYLLNGMSAKEALEKVEEVMAPKNETINTKDLLESLSFKL